MQTGFGSYDNENVKSERAIPKLESHSTCRLGTGRR